MSDELLIEWSQLGGRDPKPTPDVSVFADGRVRIGARLAGGETAWRTLSTSRLAALRRRLFEELRVMEIDGGALARDVQAAARRRRAEATAQAVPFTGAQMDSATTVIRATDGGRTREIRQHDLFASAEAYPELEALQRLRQAQLCLLELATSH